MALKGRAARSETDQSATGSPRTSESVGHVFVVTYGRSGSTLLQGLLNTLPGTLVRGESDFFIYGLYKGHLALAETQKRWSRAAEMKGPASAFYGADVIDLPVFEGDLRRSVNRQLIGPTDPQDLRWLGFKEVLWHQVTSEQTATFLEFMDVLFPNARYILHRRDHEKVLASGFWKKWDEEQAREAVIRVEEFQDALAQGRADRICWTSYEELTSDDEEESRLVLQRLTQCLGFELTPKLLGQLRKTLTIGHGPNPSTGIKPVPARPGAKKRQTGAGAVPKFGKSEPVGAPPATLPEAKSAQKIERKLTGNWTKNKRALNLRHRAAQHMPKTGVIRRPPAHDGPPRVAVMTMVHDEERMLPRWIEYYGKQVGVDNLLVLDDNSSDNSTEGLPCSVIKLPEHPWKQAWGVARVGLGNRIAEGFLTFYDVVIFTDVDEFLVPDPEKYSGLVDYLAANPDPDLIAPLGINVLHNPAVEPELNDTEPILRQRTFVKFAPGMCKPLIKRASVNWATAFHGANVPFTIDPDLLLIHLKYYDLPSMGEVASHRHQVHLADERGNKLSAWALDADELSNRVLRWVTVPDGQQVADLDPATVDLSEVVQLRKKGIYKAFAPHLEEMDKNPLLRLPDRYRSAL